MALHNKVGKWGENVAVDFLRVNGYAIMETNWQMGRYEIDIVATKGNRIIFVEVKTRTDDDFDPLDAVDRRKKQHMVRSADAFLRIKELPYEVQYDIITIIGTPHNYSLDHIPDAFVPSVTTRRGAR